MFWIPRAGIFVMRTANMAAIPTIVARMESLLWTGEKGVDGWVGYRYCRLRYLKWCPSP